MFHSNLEVNKKLTKSFSKYYREIISTWGSKFSCQTLVPSAILSQFLWFNSQVQIGNKSVFFSSFLKKDQFCWITVQNRRCSKTMEATSRRVWSSKQTEF